MTETVNASTPDPAAAEEAEKGIYTSRIIKASALISDTKVLLSEWDLTLSVAENLERARQENIFGKASRQRIDDVLTIFRQRYFTDPDVGEMLVTLTQQGAPDGWIDPLLYFFSAQNDRTLRDLVVEALYPRQMAGYSDVPVDYVVRTIRTWVAEGKTTSAWNEKTTLRVAQNALAALRDFGVLEGKAHKRITPFYLPTPTFAMTALWLQKREHSGDRVLHSDDWKLYFLPITGVERFFIEAHQQHLLTYQAAGSIVRIDFPVGDSSESPEPTLTEYAHVLLESAY